MSQRLAVFIVLLWLAPAAGFQYQKTLVVQAVFHTSTPADIIQYTTGGARPIGSSDTPVSLTIPDGTDTTLNFVVRRSGYQDTQVQVNTADLRQTSPAPVPASGLIELVPLTPWVPVRDFLWTWRTALMASTAVVGSLVAMFVLPSLKRLKRQARRLRQLIQKDDPARDVNVGKHLGRYLLVRLLGRGGAASVYAGVPADNLETGEHVAIKVLHDNKVTDEFRERFIREVNICKSLNHPNLVRLLDWDQGSIFYLVMELVDGESLRRYMRPHGMELVEAFKYLQGIFAGLSYAHEAGVVHCDLKPDNVMITTQGTVRVMDFGIATGRSYQKLTQTTDVLGTPGFIAPEQLDGLRTDPRSDEYALGVMIFEMLAGRAPFVCDDPVRLITMHLVDTAPRLSSIRPEISEAVSDVVERMLAKSPQDRYPTLPIAWEALVAASAFDQVGLNQKTMRISLTD